MGGLAVNRSKKLRVSGNILPYLGQAVQLAPDDRWQYRGGGI